MRAVAGIHNGYGQIAREEMGGSGSRMPHHDGVGPHGSEGVQRVDEGFTFGDAGGGGSDGDGVGSQALGSELETGSCARGGFKKQIHDGAAAKGIEALKGLAWGGLKVFGARENGFDLAA